MNKYDQMTDEQYTQALLDFIKKYDAPTPKTIPVLNLIMQRKFAEDILRGKKTVEVRSFSEHYWTRMTDKQVDKWMTENRNKDGMDKEAFEQFMCATRPVEKIHFYNYNNTWFLDVECQSNGLIGITRQNVEFMQNEFGCHEFDEILASFEAKNDPNRPLFYYYAVGAVIDTNLKV